MAELLVLRQELLVLRRTARRPRWREVDRLVMANARCERWISSARRECLDHLLIFGLRDLESVLREFVEHYNTARPTRD